MLTDVLSFPPHPVNVSFIPVNEAAALLRNIVREELRNKRQEELQEKMLSPAETCEMFDITKVTLNDWSAKGLLTKHYLGRRVYYKYSEVMDSLKTLKKYKKS